MIVKHISNNLFDIFFNKGWDNWARYELNNNSIKQIKGVEVPANINTFLTKRYCK